MPSNFHKLAELELLIVLFAILRFLSFIGFIKWLLLYCSIYLVIHVKLNRFNNRPANLSQKWRAPDALFGNFRGYASQNHINDCLFQSNGASL